MTGFAYAVLADFILGLHFAFILFVVAGGFFVWRWPKVAPFHLVSAAWGAFVALTNRVCPLTPLENQFLLRAGRSGYEGGFLDQYLAPVVYPRGLTPEVQAALGTFVIVWNLALYVVAWRRGRFRSAPRAPLPPGPRA